MWHKILIILIVEIGKHLIDNEIDKPNNDNLVCVDSM